MTVKRTFTKLLVQRRKSRHAAGPPVFAETVVSPGIAPESPTRSPDALLRAVSADIDLHETLHRVRRRPDSDDEVQAVRRRLDSARYFLCNLTLDGEALYGADVRRRAEELLNYVMNAPSARVPQDNEEDSFTAALHLPDDLWNDLPPSSPATARSLSWGTVGLGDDHQTSPPQSLSVRDCGQALSGRAAVTEAPKPVLSAPLSPIMEESALTAIPEEGVEEKALADERAAEAERRLLCAVHRVDTTDIAFLLEPPACDVLPDLSLHTPHLMRCTRVRPGVRGPMRRFSPVNANLAHSNATVTHLGYPYQKLGVAPVAWQSLGHPGVRLYKKASGQ